MRPDISIIIPIYNQEHYLTKALNSIIYNDFSNYEVILIDDGSTDRGINICKSICKQDRRFKYFRKENNGVASARQFGQNVATGRYIIHIDPDDWVETDYLSKLYQSAVASNADIVICDFYEDNHNESKVINHDKYIRMKHDDIKLKLAKGTLWGACWNKLIKSELVKVKIEFTPHINFQDDKLYIYKALCKTNKIFFLNKTLYHYNKNNPSSIIGTINVEKEYKAWSVHKLIINLEKGIINKWKVCDRLINIKTISSMFLCDEIKYTDLQRLINTFRVQLIIKSIIQRQLEISKRTIVLLNSLGIPKQVIKEIYTIYQNYNKRISI